MEMLKDFFKFIDRFGSEKRFKINGKEKFKSVFGGILNFIILILFLIISIFKISMEDPPIINVSEINDLDPLLFKKGENLFSLASFNSFAYNTFNIEEYFHVNNWNLKHKLDFNSDGSPKIENKFTPGLDMSKSIISSLYKEKDNQLNKGLDNSKSTLYSFTIPKDKDYQLNGTVFAGEESNSFYLTLSFCEGRKLNYSNCKDPNKFKKLYEKSDPNIFVIAMNEYYFDYSNREKPVNNRLMTHYLFNSLYSSRTIYIEIQKIEIETDKIGFSNPFFKPDIISINNIVKIEEKTIITNTLNPNDAGFVNDYLHINILKHPTKKVIKRKYKFFPEYISDTYILINMISIIVGLMYSYFNDALYKYFLFDNLVNTNEKKIALSKVSIDNLKNKNIETNNHIKSKEKDKIKENNNLINRLVPFQENLYDIELNYLDNPINPKEIKKNNNGINVEPLIKKTKFNISEEESKIQFDYLNSVNERIGLFYYLRTICKKSKLLGKITNISEKLDKKVDVLYFIRYLKNTKLIEEILLDENQVKLLKLISKKTYFFSQSEEEKRKDNKKLFIQDSNEFKKTIESLDYTDTKNIKLLNEIFELKEN
jgi:hypothetical protein